MDKLSIGKHYARFSMIFLLLFVWMILLPSKLHAWPDDAQSNIFDLTNPYAPRYFTAESNIFALDSSSLCSLTVAKSGTGTGIVSSAPAGINCGSQCKFSFSSGTPITLSAQADVGSVFTGWSGCDSVEAKKCIVTINTEKAVTAFFEQSAPYSHLNWINIKDTLDQDFQLKVASTYLYADMNRHLLTGDDFLYLRAIYSRDDSGILRPRGKVLDYAYLAQSAKKFVALNLKDSLPNAITPDHIVYEHKTPPSMQTAYDVWTPIYFREWWKEWFIFANSIESIVTLGNSDVGFGIGSTGLLGGGLNWYSARKDQYKKIIEYAVLQPQSATALKNKTNLLFTLLAKNPATTDAVKGILDTLKLTGKLTYAQTHQLLGAITISNNVTLAQSEAFLKVDAAISVGMIGAELLVTFAADAVEYMIQQALVVAEAEERMNALIYWKNEKNSNIISFDPTLSAAIDEYKEIFIKRQKQEWWPLLEREIIKLASIAIKSTATYIAKTALVVGLTKGALTLGGPISSSVWLGMMAIDYSVASTVDPAKNLTVAATLQQIIARSGIWYHFDNRFSSQTITESDVRSMVNLVNINHYLAWLHYEDAYKILTGYFRGWDIQDFIDEDSWLHVVNDKRYEMRRIVEEISPYSYFIGYETDDFEELVTDDEGQIGGITVKDLKADFTTNVDSGTANKTVFQFTDNSVVLNGSITSYTWDFGDGTPLVHGNSASHTYADSDSYYYYTVTLTVSNGVQTEQTTRYVMVESARPSASFVADKTSGVSPMTVSFTNQSTDADRYEWNFGDGTISTAAGVVVKHVYSKPGIYTVMLRAFGYGRESLQSKTNYIEVAGATGTIVVNTNLTNAFYMLRGPKITSGSGLSKTFTDMPFGNYEISCHELNGYYRPSKQSINLASAGPVSIDVKYEPILKADLNKDHDIDLKDAILAIQVFTGMEPPMRIQSGMDVDGDNKIGLPDALYILQKVAEVR